MEGRGQKGRIGFAAGLISIAAVAVTLLLLAGQSRATEDADCSQPPNPAVSYGPQSGPSVLYIGDSISNLAKDYYGFINTLHGWHSGVLAKGGATIDQHRCLNWLSWYFAHQSKPKATVIELGTNDISAIDPVSIPDKNKRLAAFAKVFNEAKWAADYLSNNRCVIWIGQNELFNTYLKDSKGHIVARLTNADSAAAFDRYIKGLVSTHSNLHYADYTAFINSNRTYLDSIKKDGTMIHPATEDGKRELAAWVSRRIDNNCI